MQLEKDMVNRNLFVAGVRLLLLLSSSLPSLFLVVDVILALVVDVAVLVAAAIVVVDVAAVVAAVLVVGVVSDLRSFLCCFFYLYNLWLFIASCSNITGLSHCCFITNAVFVVAAESFVFAGVSSLCCRCRFLWFLFLLSFLLLFLFRSCSYSCFLFSFLFLLFFLSLLLLLLMLLWLPSTTTMTIRTTMTIITTMKITTLLLQCCF